MRSQERKYTLHQLCDAVCIASGLKYEHLFGKDKDIAHIIPRGVFYMLARECGCLFVEIAKYSNRNHSTCVNGAKRFAGYYEVKDPAVCNFVAQVKQILSQASDNND